MDIPEARRVHTTPVPRGGGLAIWMTFIVSIFLLEAFSPEIFSKLHDNWLHAFAVSSLLLVVVGVLDDRKGIPALWKLAGQMAAAASFFIILSFQRDGDVSSYGMGLPGWVDGIIFVLWAVILINAFNLIDGLDGLCGGLAMIALLCLGGLAAVNGSVSALVIMYLMAGALGGFLYFNRTPARIFLGDTGSMLLGFFIAAAATQSTGRRAIVGMLLLPIAVAGVPLLDVLLALWRRSARKLINDWTGGEGKIGMFSPDKDHLHHRLLATGAGQKKVTRILHCVALILSVVAFLPMLFGDKLMALSVVTILVMGLVGLRHFANVELVHSGSVLHLAVKRPKDNRGFRFGIFLFDCLALALSAFGAVMIETNFFMRNFSAVFALQFVAVFTLLGVLSLLFIRAYRRSWSRATIRDMVGLHLAIIATGFLAVSAVSFGQHAFDFSNLRSGAIATLFALFTIQPLKCGVEVLRELALDAGHRRSPSQGGNEQNVLIYGAGDLGSLFVEYLKTSDSSQFSRFRVLGFLDRNKRLHSRIIKGFPVMGDLRDIDVISGRSKLHGIIIAIHTISPSCREEIADVAGQHGLNVYSWSADLASVEMGQPERTSLSSRVADLGSD